MMKATDKVLILMCQGFWISALISHVKQLVPVIISRVPQALHPNRPGNQKSAKSLTATPNTHWNSWQAKKNGRKM